MTLLDVSIVNVALPSIRTALDAPDSSLQWIVSGYALSFGLVLVAAGRVGDALGRRSVFITGVSIFVVSSLLAGIAQGPWWLVAARLVQGAGAGIINPQVSALIQQLFRGAECGRAFGRLGTIIGISTAVGPLLGGGIIAVFGAEQGWRWVFLVNAPVGLLTVVLALRFLDRPASRQQVRDLDPVGAILLGGGVVSLLWPLVSEGWTSWSALLLLLGAALVAVFVWWELRVVARGGEPMVRMSLFRTPGFSLGALLALVYFSGFTGIFFLYSLFTQNALGYTPLQSGAAVTPFAVGGAIMSTLGGRWVAHRGRQIVVIGLAVVLAGVIATDVVIGQLAGAHSTGWWTAAPLLVAGLGSGLVISPNQTVTLSRVPVGQAGAAGGVLQTGQRFGSAAGIALIGALYFAHAGDQEFVGVEHGLMATIALVSVALMIGLVDLWRSARMKAAQPTGQ